jgi:hypothetical protein
MSMSHKAYSFDWYGFERDPLHEIALAALKTGRLDSLIGYIDLHYQTLTDPYEGRPLPYAWQEMLQNHCVHELIDFALTGFYDPADDQGIGESWLEIERQLPDADRAALLGYPFGQPGNHFDPGRQGSYFQTPDQAHESRRHLERARVKVVELQRFQDATTMR